MAKTIARSIKVRARDRGVSLVTLQKVTGISHGPFYKRLKGETPWRIDELQMIADTLNCEVGDLLREPYDEINARFACSADSVLASLAA